MTTTDFTHAELEAAAERKIRQCVTIGAQPRLANALKSFHVFCVDEAFPSAIDGTFVRTRFNSEPLGTALAKSHFDKLKATLFVWLGGAGYRTVDAAVSTLSFVASLPKGSGVLLDYVAERSSLRSLADAALDALASHVACPNGVKELIQPQAVTTMLRSLGFRDIVDIAQDEGVHLVSAFV